MANSTLDYINEALLESKGFRRENLVSLLKREQDKQDKIDMVTYKENVIIAKNKERLKILKEVILSLESEYHSQGSYSYTSYNITTSKEELSFDSFEGEMASAVGMTVEDFIIRCKPTAIVGLFEGKRIGFRGLRLYDGDKIGNYTLRIEKGRGYSGGHTSQSDFQTSEPNPPKDSVWCVETTFEGQTSGYYPEITYITHI